jgi:hypothetical protein
LPEPLERTHMRPGPARSHAAIVADRLLRGVGTRFAHSARVAGQAARVARLLDPPWRSAVVDAAWLHDIGYSDRVASTGFHPLDGARWLRDRGWQSEVCRLVAWHTAASTEGVLRGLHGALAAEFDSPPTLAGAALAWADVTSSPTGEPSKVADRLADILRRYPADSIAHRAITEASPMLRESAHEIESRLAHHSEAL